MPDSLAPWTAEQAANIERFQHDGTVHPFTCPNCERRDALLVAETGLSCPCGYQQNWVHDFMASWPRMNEVRHDI